MRLINASTMLLETFHDAASRPPYAILSHRWIEGDEVTFDDMQRPHRQWMPAWPKIRMCCQQALADGVNYAWVDTCCIDRASSAELSEAINSMYTWYADADRCYVYLNDVDCMQYERLDASLSAYPSMPAEVLENVIASNWFTRAWTLQELLAPIEVILYDVNFRHLGSKIDFATEIEHAFAIPAEVLMNPQRLWEYPIAVRMSWAAYRKATRVEDIAYSLFGLFGVNLPLLYGEGVRAFVRLQDEIIRQTHDHSIFVWNREMTHEGEMSDQHNTSLAQLPLLASSPSDFVDSRDVILTFDTGELRPYAMTNVGLQIELKVIPFDLDVLLCLLNCKSRTTGYQYAMLVVKSGDQTNTWRRLCVKEVDIVDVNHPKWAGNFVWQKLYVVKGNIIATSHRRGPHPSKSLRSPVPFYGINIHAPAFLTAEGEAHRPYILVAHHDWDNKSRLLKADVKGDHCNPEYKAEIGACRRLGRCPAGALRAAGRPKLTLHPTELRTPTLAPEDRTWRPPPSAPPRFEAVLEDGEEPAEADAVVARHVRPRRPREPEPRGRDQEVAVARDEEGREQGPDDGGGAVALHLLGEEPLQVRRDLPGPSDQRR